jgi:hypothetical protein
MLQPLLELNEDVMVWNSTTRRKLLSFFDYPIAKSSDGFPLVENKYHRVVSADDTFTIMRPSDWGNPYAVCDYEEYNKDDQREIVVAMHILTLLCNAHAIIVCSKTMRGKRLLCCCYPKLCHGNILVLLSNNPLFFVQGLKRLCDYITAQKNSGNPVVSDNMHTAIYATYLDVKPILAPRLKLISTKG